MIKNNTNSQNQYKKCNSICNYHKLSPCKKHMKIDFHPTSYFLIYGTLPMRGSFICAFIHF